MLLELAKQNTKEGFEAFTQYWFDAVSYAQNTGDLSVLNAASTEDCRLCQHFLNETRITFASGGWYTAPNWKIRDFESPATLDSKGQSHGFFLLQETSSSRFDSEGQIVESLRGEDDGSIKVILAVFTNGAWRAAQIGQA